ncbi:MAG: IS91 family transposase [Giesbergeria sp.]
MPTTAKPKLYNPRHPERTLLYQTVAEHYETWLELASAGQFDGQGDHHTPKPFVCKAFAKYLECGIFAHGFARARCGDCGHDYFVAFSCKGRGVCPSCTTRRMVETAAHLNDHVFPRLPVRQWVLSVPKRLRYFMQRDGAVLSMVLRIFLRVIAQTLQTHSPGAAHMDKAGLHIGAIAFIHRFGSSLNEHVHFHVCVVDGVFEEVAGRGRALMPQCKSHAPGVVFHRGHRHRCGYRGPSADHTAKTHPARLRVLGACWRTVTPKTCWATNTAASRWTPVCASKPTTALRWSGCCAIAPAHRFAMERLRKEGSELVYRCAKQRSEPTSDKRGAKADELHLTPLELIDRIAALVPPPRTHRHRYFGVLAPNSPLRAAVTALATPAQAAPVLGASISTGECAPGVVPMSSALPSQSEPVLPKRAAHYLWAVLIARIYEVFPLLCPLCGGHMRIIAFITHSADIRHILDHIGADSEPPRISPARGPPLWDDCSDAQMDDGAQTEPADWDLAAQPAPDFEVDQRISW